MKISINRKSFGSGGYLLFFIFPLLQAAEPMPIDSLWKSESFRKAYTASYGIDSRIEPLINEDESFYLGEAAKLMADDDRPAAIQKLIDSDIVEESPALLFSLGNFHYEEGNPKVSIDYFEKAIALFPNFRDAHRNVAMLKIQSDNYEEAEKHLKRAIELGSQEGLTYGLLAFCHTRNKRLQAALSAYRMAQVTMPDEIQWQLGEAYTLQALDEAEKAASIYATLIEKFPTDTDLWINQANSLAQKQDDLQAVAHLEMASRMKELSPQNRIVLGQMYLEQSLADLALNNFQSAVVDRGIKLDTAVNCLGLLSTKSKWIEAKAFGENCGTIYRRELALPDNRKLRSSFERTMALVEMETGDSDDAAKRVEALLKKEPLDGDALLLLAKFRELNNQPEEAILLLEQAAIVPENKGAALLALGRVLVNQFRYKEALEHLEESQQIAPRDSLKRYIEAIRELNE